MSWELYVKDHPITLKSPSLNWKGLIPILLIAAKLSWHIIPVGRYFKRTKKTNNLKP